MVIEKYVISTILCLLYKQIIKKPWMYFIFLFFLKLPDFFIHKSWNTLFISSNLPDNLVNDDPQKNYLHSHTILSHNQQPVSISQQHPVPQSHTHSALASAILKNREPFFYDNKNPLQVAPVNNLTCIKINNLKWFWIQGIFQIKLLAFLRKPDKKVLSGKH